MNILIYIPNITQDWGGVRQYSLGLVRILAQDRSNSYFIYHNIHDPEVIGFLEGNKQLKWIKDEDYRSVNHYRSLAIVRRGFNYLLRRIKVKGQINQRSVLDKICINNKIDIIHCPYQFIPHTTKAKLITTLHDVQEIHFPEYFTPEERARRASGYLDYLTRANKVIVSYNHVKNDLIKYFRVPPGKIQVILLDMGKLWFEKYLELDVIDLKHLNLPEKFIFYPANTWKHKNHIRLLQAVALLRDKYKLTVNLICSGYLTDYYQEEIVSVYQELNLQEQVRFLGVVSENELYAIYKNALGVVVPTVYEAGSFPLMESILLKVPVICSNVTSLPETIQDLSFVFDPFRVEDIAGKLKELWVSDVFRKRSIDNSEQIVDSLVHTNSLERFKLLYEDLKEI